MLKSYMKRPSAERPWLRPVREGEAPAQLSPLASLSDDQIIEAVVTGDTRVAGAIHDRLIGVIDHTLFRVLGRREHDHDDLVQTCFEQVLRTLTEVTFARNCSLRTWAGRISTHIALNALRSRQRERKVIHRPEQTPEGFEVVKHDGQAEAQVELSHIRRELAAMKPSRAEVLVLHDVHGYSLNEVAMMLQLSVSAAQSRLVRGRSDLRKRLERRESAASWRLT
jgi:RNA polymerase sigma-70 factor, ECF subfamily